MPKQVAKPKYSLDVTEDWEFQKRNWRAERIAWIVMAAIVAAALGGLFAVGPLSDGRASDPARRLEVEYPRFMRLGAASLLVVRLPPESVGEGRFALELGPEFTRMLKPIQIVPQPVRALAGGRLRLEFAASAAQPATVHIHVEPIRFGAETLRIALGGAEPAELPVFVYP